MVTTNAADYLYVKTDKVEGDDFYVVVQADIFAKLVSRLTCERVSMEVKDNSMSIIGNGTYTIELPLNEEGELIKFPDPLAHLNSGEYDEVDDINLTTVRLILNTAKASVATVDDNPCYTGYYCGDKIVTTDTYKMCGIAIKMFQKPALIGATTMDLLDLFDTERIEAKRAGDDIVFETTNTVVCGKLMDSIDEFQIDAIDGLLCQEFDSHCKVAKSSLIQLLDRLALFVVEYDNNGVYLTFTRDGLQVDCKRTNSTELIHYASSEDFKDFTCCIDIEMFRSQVKAHAGDSIEIHYGLDNAISFVDGNITQVIALLEDDRG